MAYAVLYIYSLQVRVTNTKTKPFVHRGKRTGGRAPSAARRSSARRTSSCQRPRSRRAAPPRTAGTAAPSRAGRARADRTAGASRRAHRSSTLRCERPYLLWQNTMNARPWIRLLRFHRLSPVSPEAETGVTSNRASANDSHAVVAARMAERSAGSTKHASAPHARMAASQSGRSGGAPP